jgi:hypothetical protein
MAAVPTLFLAFSFMAVTNEVLDVGVWKLVWAQVINISVCCLWYTVGKSYKSSRDAEFYTYIRPFPSAVYRICVAINGSVNK